MQLQSKTHTDIQIYSETDKHCRQTDRHINRQTDRQTERQTDKITDIKPQRQ